MLNLKNKYHRKSRQSISLGYLPPERIRSSGYKRKVNNGSVNSRKNVFKTHAGK
jgi:hypothetical protein